MAAIRVALVDDQSLFRTGIRMLVASQPDLEVVGEAGNGHEAVVMAAATQPRTSCSWTSGCPSWMESPRRPRSWPRQGPVAAPRQIIVLTTFDLDEAATRAIRGGASGFVLKDADPEFLLAAIRTVHAGNAVIAASATRELFEHFTVRPVRQEVPPSFGQLTSRERDIFLLAARGLSNAEIASGEFLSEATVKTHVSRILAKLGLRDRVQLVVFAFEHGLNG